MYVEVVFPLPFRQTFTYRVPEELEPFAIMGVRTVAPFGKRTITGFIVNTSLKTSVKEKIKSIYDILDDSPVLDNLRLKFYEWLSDYYLSSLGEALRLAVPLGTDVASKRKILIDPEYCEKLLSEEKKKTSVRATILKELTTRIQITQSHLSKLVGKKNIYSQIRTLQKQGAITITDDVEKAKVKPKKVKYVKLSKTIGEVYAAFPELESHSPKQVKILLELIAIKSKEKLLPVAELLHKTESSKASIDSLQKKGFITVFDKEVERRYSEAYSEDHQELKATVQQAAIIKSVAPLIKKEKFHTFLIHGVTGSGKTQVYIELTKEALKQKKTVLILVPEISLTPQMTSRLFNNFGDTVTVIHSRMSAGQRFDSWRRVLSGKSRVVIGARSALFAPLRNIGLIVVDEEHDASYKQAELIPRYNARDAAVYLGNLNKCPVVLGSATPSIESMYNAKTGKYQLLELPERIDDAKLPHIKFVNINIERKKKKMENVFSRTLLDKIEDRLKKKEGTIILQNRRGFSTQIYCEDCGEVETCDNCSVPMVFHINKNIIQCHYCGLVKDVPGACTNCGSLAIKYFGTGTERVEDELAYYFPSANITRVDSDSISRKAVLSKILLSFSKGDIDILVGTQMVSKGLDFSRVTLVGVIAAETTLWLPDFRADERTFQLLTQVSGRAGRSQVPGEVIIQTQNEKHFTLQMVLKNDYFGFYNKELADRQKMGYPPFTRIALIETKDQSEKKARGAIYDFYNELKKYKKWLNISSPAYAVIARLKDNYRFHILIKSSKDDDPGGAVLRKAILNSFVEFNRKSRYKDVKLFYDIDPQSIM
ncbi:MAG: primosomal protein N' [Bacteroidetes bacterium]|nr:primosomal protein N' [Bacteroidota bacterium]